MNAISHNRYTEAWASLGKRFAKPKAILAISAHWYIRGTAVTAMPKPPVIHDFGGFPQALHAFDYPAPGDPALAARVKSLLAPLPVRLDDEWGLDHGTWSVLTHAYPEADVPIVQLSIDGTQPARFHYEVGQRIAPLRDEGIMLVGSGNVVHNLRLIRRADDHAYQWAVQFNETMREYIEKNDHARLVRYEELGASAQMSVPTPEHFLPLLYIAGARRDDDTTTILVDGLEMASISMMSVLYAADK